MIRNIVLATLIFGLGLVGFQAEASANLLSDAGFDTQAVAAIGWGTTPWWGGGGGANLQSGGGAWVTDAKASSPSHSATAFLFGTDWAWAVIGQDVNGISGNTGYAASASFLRDADLTNAKAIFKIEWWDAGNSKIREDAGTVAFDNANAANTWTLVSDQFTSPSNAVSAKYMISYAKDAGIDPGDIWVDNANFDVVPEPASLMLLGSGLLGLFGVTRKKK